ncbi:MAG: MATE family efflux transporter [[Bacteroides] pectinophilus]|nr:MATE family efflux transporter [[Bacteroides] pectinophilus]
MRQDLKGFYRAVATLVIPLALQNLINVGVSAADVFMLGMVGEKALAASSLAGQVQYIMTLIFFGLSSGASVLIAQYWGKGNLDAIKKVLGISVKIGLVVSVLFTVVTYAFPWQLMHLLTNDEEVMALGVKYMRIVCWSYVISSMTMVYLNTMRSIERVVISMGTYLVSLIVNIIFNAIFIFGLCGLPAMGIVGAACATFLARVVEFIIVVVYDRRFNPVFRFSFSFFKKDDLLFKDYVKFSVPVVCNELMWGSGCAVITAIIGHLGSSMTAANSAAQVARQLAVVLALGIANATAIMIGKVIGEGKMELAREYGTRFVRLSLIVGAIGSIVILIVRPVLLTVMSLTPEASEYLSLMMFVMTYFVFFQSYNTVLVVGIFRAGGDTKFGLLIDVGFMWGFSIIAGAIAAFVLKVPPMLVYVLLLSDEVLKVPFSTLRYKQRRWLNNVTR